MGSLSPEGCPAGGAGAGEGGAAPAGGVAASAPGPPPAPRAWMLGMKYDGHPFRCVTEFPQTEETPGVRN